MPEGGPGEEDRPQGDASRSFRKAAERPGEGPVMMRIANALRYGGHIEMQEVVHPFDCDCNRCTQYDENGNEVKGDKK